MELRKAAEFAISFVEGPVGVGMLNRHYDWVFRLQTRPEKPYQEQSGRVIVRVQDWHMRALNGSTKEIGGDMQAALLRVTEFAASELESRLSQPSEKSVLLLGLPESMLGDLADLDLQYVQDQRVDKWIPVAQQPPRFADATIPAVETSGHPNAGRVFVVHGRNMAVKGSLFAFLRSIGLEPIEWRQAVAATGQASPYIGDVLDAAMAMARAVVILQTPDDVVRLREELLSATDGTYERDEQLQPRPNVIFEAGLAFGRIPDRTVLLEVGSVKWFSDLTGRHVVRLNNSAERRAELANRLATAGCSLDLSGTDWYSVGDFETVIDQPAAEGIAEGGA